MLCCKFSEYDAVLGSHPSDEPEHELERDPADWVGEAQNQTKLMQTDANFPNVVQYILDITSSPAAKQWRPIDHKLH